jgi:hypothetical protein
MVIIKQLYCYTCTLACVQSFLADHYREQYTQSNLIYTFPDLCFVNDPEKRIGAFDFSRLNELGAAVGFTVDNFPVGTPVETIAIGQKQTVFISTHTKTGHDVWYHTVRLKEIVGDTVWVMDPSHGINTEVLSFDQWTKQLIADRQCEFKRLTLL